MSLTADPVLSVDGQTIPATTAASPTLVGIEQVRVTYGRQGVFDQSTPSTASLTVLDTAHGAPFARRTDLIGRLVVLSWDAHLSGVAPGVIFRGRITDVEVTPHAHGYRVALSASSLEVDLASVVMPEGTTFPAETFAARATRLAGYIPAGTAALDLGPGSLFDTTPCAARTAGGTDLLSLLRELFTSVAPFPMVYDPSWVNPRSEAGPVPMLTYVPRRRYAYGDQADPLGRGSNHKTTTAYLAAAAALGGKLVGASVGGLHLDGHDLAYSGSLSARPEQKLTRVEVTYTDPTAGSLTVAAATKWTPDEATTGRRTLSVTSLHTTAANATALANAYADVVNLEGASRTLGTISYSTARRPLADVNAAAVLLAGVERSAVLFVGRSWWTALGRRPLVGILGGTLTYTGGEWLIDLTPAPIAVDPLGHAYGPATIASAAPAVKLSDVHESVTFGDLGFVDVGPGWFPGNDYPYVGNAQ